MNQPKLDKIMERHSTITSFLDSLAELVEAGMHDFALAKPHLASDVTQLIESKLGTLTAKVEMWPEPFIEIWCRAFERDAFEPIKIFSVRLHTIPLTGMNVSVN